MELMNILERAVKEDASDIFLVVGQAVSFKLDGTIRKMDETKLMPVDTENIITSIYDKAGRSLSHFMTTGDDDFSLSIANLGRFRCNVFRQRGTFGAVIRVVHFELPSYKDMRIPESIMKLSELNKGLVLVTGAAGSGKSTTISYIIDRINENRNCHILTLEDPIEFLHRHKKSIVSQREVKIDSESYSSALRAALRQSPDVILVGEMRDYETIDIAMTAAETGHLVLSTLHTIGAANTIDRVIDVFPASQQQQIRVQLSMVLQAVVSQQLIPGLNNELLPAFEIMKANSAIKTMIRDNKIHQLDSVIYSSGKEDMRTMDSSILELYTQGLIDSQTAINFATNQEMVGRACNR